MSVKTEDKKKIEQAIANLENLPAAKTDNVHKARVGIIGALRRSLAWGYTPREAVAEAVLCKPVEKALAATWLRQCRNVALMLGVVTRGAGSVKAKEPA
jgi:hypothetical protein